MRRVNVTCHQASATRMLEDTERQTSVTVARWVAEGMIRAAVDFLFRKAGPLTAYNMLTTIEDELALRSAGQDAKNATERRP